MTFDSLNIIEPIKKALIDLNYSNPTPIQRQAIPIILEGTDLLGCAQTGTGKTAAFAIPILQLLTPNNTSRKGKRQIKSLILTPTRELAIQISESFKDYGKYLNLKNTVIFGGVKQGLQVDILHNGIDILIATPGRLLDLISQKYINLSSLEIFVLDEADRMLDMGFVNDVKKILKFLPKKRHSLFFSATMPPNILELSNTILINPKKVEVTPVSSTAETINQSVYFVDKKDKVALLLDILDKKPIENVLVFTRTKHGADKIVKMLIKKNHKAEAIHGNKSQNARQRALTNFKNKETKILVATDIAARGIDIDELKYVINFEIPNIPETYVHRIGRTGRAGADGIAFTFCDVEEIVLLKDIQKLIGKTLPTAENNPFELSEEPMKNLVLKSKSEINSKKSKKQNPDNRIKKWIKKM